MMEEGGGERVYIIGNAPGRVTQGMIGVIHCNCGLMNVSSDGEA